MEIRLAKLLEAEDKIYEEEFMANLETPEQVREKMAQRLFDLKNRREEERQEEVNRRLEQRFKDTTDELRKEDSKFYTLHCQLEREKQLMEKQKRMQQEIMEEGVYAQLWQLELEKKQERERKEQEEKKKKIGNTMAVLDWQKETRLTNKDMHKQQQQQEKHMLKNNWQREEMNEKEIERQKFLLNRERNLELIRHNEAEKQLRDEQEKMEKDRDKKLLQQALDRESALEQLEQEEKLKRRREVVELQKHYMQQAQDKKAEEEMIEYLTWLESEKQWKMKEDKWRKEDQARINLLKKVYDNRAQNIELKSKVKGEDQWLKKYEQDMIQLEIERQEREHQEKLEREAAEKKKHQGDVLLQINERDRTKRRELQDKMFEERAAKLAEVNYVRKIGVQKNENTNLLTQFRGQMFQ